MSAVRMVAYGVLELPTIRPKAWSDNGDLERKEAFYKRDEIIMLVRQELERYGLLIKLSVHGSYVLLGPVQGLLNDKPKGFVHRQELRRGTFRECCVRAAELLDQLEPGT